MPKTPLAANVLLCIQLAETCVLLPFDLYEVLWASENRAPKRLRDADVLLLHHVNREAE
jgi:hypothetical protein